MKQKTETITVAVEMEITYDLTRDGSRNQVIKCAVQELPTELLGVCTAHGRYSIKRGRKYLHELERELNEQVLCNGKGAEREADLLGKVERLEREIARLREAGKALRDALAFECHKLGDCPREIDEWDALVSASA